MEKQSSTIEHARSRHRPVDTWGQYCVSQINYQCNFVSSAQNKTRLSSLNHKNDAKSVWKAVRQVTGAKHNTTVVDGISAESLNNHYVSIDRHYSQPKYKSTCPSEQKDFVSEFTVFRMLDQLRPTSTGLDLLLSLIHI